MNTLRTIRFVVSILTISGLGHWVLARWALRVFPALAARRRVFTRAVFALAVSPIVFRYVTYLRKTELADELYAATMMEFILAGITAVPVGVIEALAYVSARRARSRAIEDAAASPPAAPAPEGTSAREERRVISRREAIERVSGLAVLGTTSVALGWGMTRGRHAFAIEEVAVRIPGLPRVLDGYTIAQISDIHVGLFVGERELREGLDRVREVRADMVVATGDLIDYDARYAPMMARALGDLPARDGVFAILGNHDYYTGHLAVRQALAASKVELLFNSGRRVRPADGGGFALLGTDDRWAVGYGGTGPDLSRAIAMVPPDAPRILLAHQPNCLEWAAGRVALQLSGHTHGGQINPVLRPADLFMRYVSGRYERSGTTMWVNRGFGVAGPPARIGAPPEVTKIVLVAA